MQETNNMSPILIIEDDIAIRDSLQDILEYEGYKVAVATNGLEGLNYLQSSPTPSLVLLDMQMPYMNGRELLDIMMKDIELSKIPVLILSANANASNSHGSVGFMRKPLDLDVFLEKVEAYC